MKSYTKVLIISGNALIVTAAIIFSRSQITGYELSIYESVYVPLFGLILSYFLSVVVVVTSIYENCKYGKYLGILNIGLCALLVILLPYIRGYVYASLADNSSHVGYILDILTAGNIPLNNVYPIVHLLGAILSSITSSPLDIVAYLIPPSYYIIYAFSIFLLCRSIFSEKVALIALICSLTPLCYYYSHIMPMGTGFMTLPLVAFFLIMIFHHQSLNWSIPFLIYIMILPFWHPLSFLMALTIVILFLIVTTVFQSRLQIKSLFPSINSNIARYIMHFVIISLIVFIYWSLQNLIIDGFLESVKSIFDASPVAIAPIDDAGNAFAKLGLNFIDVIFLYVKLYGPLTIFGFFSILGFFHVLNQFFSSNFTKRLSHDKSIFSLIFVYAVFFTFCIVAAIDFVKPLTGLGSQRFLFAVYALVPVPAALGLSLLLPKTWTYLKRGKSDVANKLNQMNVFKPVCLILALTVCFSVAFFSFFTSPAVYRPNTAITVKEVSGAEWIMHNGYTSYNILWDGKSVSRPYQYSNVIFGTTSDAKYPKIEPNLFEDEFAHFRYEKFSTLGSSISANKYLMLRGEVNLLIYQELYPLLARYIPLDFIKLSGDDSVNLLYSNDEMKIYLVLAS